MSARESDEPLVDLVLVDGAPIEPGVDPDALDTRPSRHRPTVRLLALGAVTLIGAGVLAGALMHGRHGAPRAAATGVPTGPATNAAPIAPTAQPGGGASEPASSDGPEVLPAFVLVSPDSLPDCPPGGGCWVTFGRMAAPALAAVTSRLAHAAAVSRSAASGYDGRGALFLRQLQVRSRGCVLTLQVVRAGAVDASGPSTLVLRAADGTLTFAEFRAQDGYVALFGLAGMASNCPSDRTMAAIAADPALLAES